MIARGIQRGVNGLKWKSLEEFIDHHETIINRICDATAPESHYIVIADISCELWRELRTVAGRTPTSLCFDCCYLVLRLSGNAISIPDMNDIALQILGRPLTVWRAGNDGAWWKKPKCKEIILDICGGGDTEAIMPLYEDIISGWFNEEE